MSNSRSSRGGSDLSTPPSSVNDGETSPRRVSAAAARQLRLETSRAARITRQRSERSERERVGGDATPARRADQIASTVPSSAAAGAPRRGRSATSSSSQSSSRPTDTPISSTAPVPVSTDPYSSPVATINTRGRVVDPAVDAYNRGGQLLSSLRLSRGEREDGASSGSSASSTPQHHIQSLQSQGQSPHQSQLLQRQQQAEVSRREMGWGANRATRAPRFQRTSGRGATQNSHSDGDGRGERERQGYSGGASGTGTTPYTSSRYVQYEYQVCSSYQVTVIMINVSYFMFCVV